MANKTLLVAQREYLDNVRTKTFWLGILAFPAIFALAIGIGWIMQKTKKTQDYAVADFTSTRIGAEVERAARSSDLLDLIRENLDKIPEQFRAAAGSLTAEQLEAGLASIPADYRAQVERQVEGKKQKFRYRSLDDLGLAGRPEGEVMASLNDRVRDGQLFGFFVFQRDPVARLAEPAVGSESAASNVKFICDNTNDTDLRQWYEGAATSVIRKQRLEHANIADETARYVSQRVSFTAEQPSAVAGSSDTKAVESADRARNFAPVVFVYLLWIAIFTAAQMLLTNTVEEKSNRIIEVLLSSVSPSELMAGKIWGIGATGLTMVLSWATFGVIGMSVGAKVIPMIAEMDMLGIARDPLYLASFVGYFLTGYLLFAAVLVAIGSVCNSLKEAQNLLQPVFLLLMIPLFAMIPIVQEPNGLMARVFTYIPLYTPFAMMNRASGPPPAWEYAVTTVLILVSVVLAFKAAGKIFRVGVLMTGNPPKLKEIFSWLREK
jgi:ABC-2 type transport system permease protein